MRTGSKVGQAQGATSAGPELRVSKARSLRTSLLMLIGLPLFVGISVQGAMAVVTNIPYQKELARLMEAEPAAAPILQGNLDATLAMAPTMQGMSGVVLVLGLLTAWSAAKLFTARFRHMGLAAERMASGALEQEIPLVRDLVFDPVVHELNLVRRKMQERVALEVERTELNRAMELGAEVQRMFLPSHTRLGHPHIRASSAYRPATTCGGDFWFSHVTPAGRLLVFLGDVTGHGTGAAVVTAAVATQIRMQLARSDDVDVQQVLARLNESVLDLCRGSYRMTMAVLDIPSDASCLRYHSAGAPPVVMRSACGDIDTLTVAGVPLGSARFEAGLAERLLAPGTRIHAFTDGLVEAEREDGRAFGLRRVGVRLSQLATEPVEQVCDEMLQTIDQFAAGVPQDDDWTMLALEVA